MYLTFLCGYKARPVDLRNFRAGYRVRPPPVFSNPPPFNEITLGGAVTYKELIKVMRSFDEKDLETRWSGAGASDN